MKWQRIKADGSREIASDDDLANRVKSLGGSYIRMER